MLHDDASDFLSARDNLDIATVRAGTLWYRMRWNDRTTPTTAPPITDANNLLCSSGTARFSDPRVPPSFGEVYLGRSVKVCFAETILRDAKVLNATYVLSLRTTERRSVLDIVVRQDLSLVDLRADNLARMGIDTDAARARDQTMGRVWSYAFHSYTTPQVDGVIYASRINGEDCLAIYDRAVGKLDVVATTRLDLHPARSRIITALDIPTIP